MYQDWLPSGSGERENTTINIEFVTKRIQAKRKKKSNNILWHNTEIRCKILYFATQVPIKN